MVRYPWISNRKLIVPARAQTRAVLCSPFWVSVDIHHHINLKKIEHFNETKTKCLSTQSIVNELWCVTSNSRPFRPAHLPCHQPHTYGRSARNFFKDGRTVKVIHRDRWMTKKKVPTSSYLSMLPKQDRCTVCDLNQPFSCILARWGPQSSSWWRGARAGTVCWVAQQPEKDKDAQFQDIILSPTHYTLRTHHVYIYGGPKRTQHKEFGPQNFGLNG